MPVTLLYDILIANELKNILLSTIPKICPLRNGTAQLLFFSYGAILLLF